MHFCTQNYRSVMLEYQKGKMAEKPQKNSQKQQRIVLKFKDWLNKENIVLFWLGRISKFTRILSENGRPEMFFKNGRFLPKMGVLESPQFILTTISVITFHKLYQQHSEMLSLQDSKTKVIGISILTCMPS